MATTGDPRMSALVLVMLLGIRCGPNAGYVAGGSRAFSEAIAQHYQGLGGQIRYNTQVTSILVRDDRANGVRCAGEKHSPGSTIVSCADGYTTIFKMLEGRYVNRQIRCQVGMSRR